MAAETRVIVSITALVGLLTVVACLGTTQGEPPPKSDAPAYAEHLARKAIAMYDDQGAEQTIVHYSSPDSVDGPWYVFIDSADTARVVAHPNPEVIGRDLNAATDSTGFCYGCAFLEATAEGAVVSYRYLNPETNTEGIKHSFVVMHDGYIFGAGWYEDASQGQ